MRKSIIFVKIEFKKLKLIFLSLGNKKWREKKSKFNLILFFLFFVVILKNVQEIKHTNSKKALNSL